jgi:phytol kinase
MITAHDLRGAAIIAGAFLTLLVIAEVWIRTGTAKPEWTRKLVHLGGGVIGLALPFLIDSALVVFILTASLSSLFLLGEKTGLMKSLHGVERKSRGSEYYPLAIFLVFVLVGDKPWLYLSAVLVLALADAFAAIIGSKYGVLRYEVEDEFKSVEGSLVFFFVAFMAVHLPMLLMTDLPRPVCVLSALLVAMLVTLFEAISLRGTDNLFVPVAVVFVLQKITTKSLAEIASQNIRLALLILLIVLLAWRFKWFNFGGALTISLFTFATLSLGGWRWAVPVFLALALLMGVRMWVVLRGGHKLRVRVIARASLVPFAFLLAANLTTNQDYFFGPYLAANAAVVAVMLWIGGVRMRLFSGWKRWLAAGAMGVIASVAIAIPMWAVYRTTPVEALVAVILVVAAVSIANALIIHSARWETTPFLLAALSGVVVLALQTIGIVPSWRSITTVPAPPSIVTRSPDLTSEVSPRMPTMVGMPISRATIAECERIEPRSMSRPEIDG